MFDRFLTPNDTLTKIHTYELSRGRERCFIHIHEALFPDQEGYLAIPDLLIREADPKYCGMGDTVEKALENCLQKIKGIPLTQIFPEGK
ncbi:MAG TPA: hypothetical protein EYP21_04555 [Syntrophaceae bacterium]|nr:hypothetical protein [Syntrophaceae bacterium]